MKMLIMLITLNACIGRAVWWRRCACAATSALWPPVSCVEFIDSAALRLESSNLQRFDKAAVEGHTGPHVHLNTHIEYTITTPHTHHCTHNYTTKPLPHTRSAYNNVDRTLVCIKMKCVWGTDGVFSVSDEATHILWFIERLLQRRENWMMTRDFWEQ